MVAVMGGIRLTRTQQILVDYQSGLLLIIFYAAIPVLIAMLVSFPKTERNRPARAEVRRSGRKLARGPWVLAASSIAVLVVFGFPFQVSYWEAAEIDRLLASGRFQEAVERLERNGPGSPPATWDPLPLGSQRSQQPVDILPIIEELARRQAPA